MKYYYLPPMGGEVEESCNDTGVCFLGETNSLVSYAELCVYFGVTQGDLNTTSTGHQNAWLHFTLDGKELFVSKVAIRNAISWNHLYSRGLVYGVDGVGYNPTGTPTNVGYACYAWMACLFREDLNKRHISQGLRYPG